MSSFVNKSCRVIHPSALDFVARKSEILAGADEFHRYDNNECQHWNPPFSNKPVHVVWLSGSHFPCGENQPRRFGMWNPCRCRRISSVWQQRVPTLESPISNKPVHGVWLSGSHFSCDENQPRRFGGVLHASPLPLPVMTAEFNMLPLTESKDCGMWVGWVSYTGAVFMYRCRSIVWNLKKGVYMATPRQKPAGVERGERSKRETHEFLVCYK